MLVITALPLLVLPGCLKVSVLPAPVDVALLTRLTCVELGTVRTKSVGLVGMPVPTAAIPITIPVVFGEIDVKFLEPLVTVPVTAIAKTSRVAADTVVLSAA